MSHTDDEFRDEEEAREAPIEPDPLDDLSDPDDPEANAKGDEEERNGDLVNQELNDLKDQLLRTMADFQNFRKRAQQDKVFTQKIASENLVRDLLPVLDNFERTVAASDGGATIESIVEGVRMVHKQMMSVLAQRNLERIKTVGEAFDPEFHEAIGTEVRDDVEDGTITVELEAGYRMADRTIRPARVRVAKKS